MTRMKDPSTGRFLPGSHLSSSINGQNYYWCWSCKTNQSTTHFYKDKSRPDGINHSCKKCSDKRYRKYIKQNPNKKKTILPERKKV